MPALLSRTRVGRGGIVQVPVNEIDPNPNQPRRAFDGERLAALAESIAQYGVLSPITVRLRYGRYELIAGERRLRALRHDPLRHGGGHGAGVPGPAPVDNGNPVHTVHFLSR